MIWDDILSDSMKQESVTFSPELYARPWKQPAAYHEQPLDFEQALISKKDFTKTIDENKRFIVNREYINSKEFHDKFDKLPLRPDVRQAIYLQTGRLLEYVDGGPNERLIAIDAKTGKLLLDNFDKPAETYRTGFSNEEIEMLDKHKHPVIYIHNHSYNGRPSAADINYLARHTNASLSIIACHDGTTYCISNVKPETLTVYEKLENEYKNQLTDYDEVKRLATTRLYNENNERSKRHKLFNVNIL